jgi:hypothetical protein
VEILYERVAAIDVHKKQITVAVRTPGGQSDERRQQVRKYPTGLSASVALIWNARRMTAG